MVYSGHASTSTAKPNIHDKKLVLCIWWYQLVVIYWELLKPNETFTDVYRRQLMRLKEAMQKEQPILHDRHDKIILQHDNTRPHVASVVKTYLEGQNWEVLPQPPYSTGIAPSDYHLL